MFMIGFNGPPRSGKDTLAAAISLLPEITTQHDAHTMSLATPMREAIYALLNMPYSTAHYEQNKDVAFPLLQGQTIRQAMIRLSEEHVKKLYGHTFWAESLWRKLEWLQFTSRLCLVPDIGFPSEARFFAGKLGQRFLNVQLSRRGCDFSNDSRDYVPAESHAGRTYAMENNDTPRNAAQKILHHCRHELGWTI